MAPIMTRCFPQTQVVCRGGGVCVCMYGYVFRRALRYSAKSWRGGRGHAHEVCGYIFGTTPPRVKAHPEVKLLYKCPLATKLDRKKS